MSDVFYPAVIRELSDEDGGGFLASAPDLYGCQSDGETPEEALRNLQGAVLDWIDRCVAMGRDVPLPNSCAETVRHDVQNDAGIWEHTIVVRQEERLHS